MGIESYTSEALTRLVMQAGGNIKQESFGFFLDDYVVDGAVYTADPVNTHKFSVSSATISFADALFTIDGKEFTIARPSALFFLDFTVKSGFVLGIVHPTDAYLPLWEITTNAGGNIAAATDKRGATGFLRFRAEVEGIVTDLIVVDEARLTSNSVSTAKIQPKAVTGGKIADLAIEDKHIKGPIYENKLDLDYHTGTLGQRLIQLEAQSRDFEVIGARGGYDSLGQRLDSLDPAVFVLRKAFTATEGQTVFDISDVGPYSTGQNHLFVAVGGVPQNGHFTETSSTSFMMSEGVPGGLEVIAEWFKGAFSLLSGHGRAHRKGGGDELNVFDLTGGENIVSQTEFAVSIKRFGAKGNGIQNDTAAIMTTLAFARDNGIPRVFAPSGTYLIDAVTYNTLDNGINIFDGLTFEGNGESTEFLLNPASLTTNETRIMFSVGRNVTCRNFRINGNKAVFNNPAVTNMVVYGIRHRYNGVMNNRFEKIKFHDIPAVGANSESFGIFMIGDATSAIVYKDLEAWGIQGTGIHVNGDIAANGHDIQVINCKTWDNTWMGISIYGCNNVQVYNHQSYGNLKNGINIEWSTNVSLFNCHSYENTTNVNSYGKTSFKAFDCVLHDATDKEIGLAVGSWYTGSPRACAGDVELHNCSVKPASGRYHMYMNGDNAVTIGNGIPDSVLINCVDARDWRIFSRQPDGNGGFDYMLPCVRFSNIDIVGPVALGKLQGFSKTDNITVTAYTDGGNLDSDAVRLTSAIRTKNIFSGFQLKAGHTYLIKMRVKPESENEWRFLFHNAIDLTATPKQMVLSNIKMPSQWYEAELIIATGADDYRVQIENKADISSSIVVDYISVFELRSNIGQSKTTVPTDLSCTMNGTMNLVANTWTPLVYDTESNDVNNEFDPVSGVFTAKAAGTYLVSAGLKYDQTNPANNEMQLAVYKNGVIHRRIFWQMQGGTAGVIVTQGTTIVQLTAGETLAIYAFSKLASLTSSDITSNYLNIAKMR